MADGSPVSKRLTEKMAPEVQELIYKPRLNSEIDNNFEHIGDVNQAHLLMLVKEGIIAPGTGKTLAQALVELEAKGANAITRNTALEDAHFNFEATLIEMTGSEAGGRIHIGRSRNDMGATIDRMRARRYCLEIATALNALRDGALEQTARHIDVVMPGYTHLQSAQPITFGFYCLGVEQAFARDFTRLRSSFTTTNRCPMGAAAFAGTSFPINRGFVAEILGFDGLVEHSLDAVASRDFLSEMGSTCVNLGITWSRMAQDLYVWSTDEFQLVDFPDRLTGTSSIMPQKKNPVVLEFLKATAAQNIGDMVSMHTTMRGTHFTNSIDGVRASTRGAWQVLDTTAKSLTLAGLVMKLVVPLPANMLARVRNSFATITGLAEVLVQEFDVSFRDAHHICGAVVRAALDRGLSSDGIDVAMVEEAGREVIGRSLNCDATQLAGILDPQRSLKEQRSLGGPSPNEVAKLLGSARQALVQNTADVKLLGETLRTARAKLKKEIKSLANG